MTLVSSKYNLGDMVSYVRNTTREIVTARILKVLDLDSDARFWPKARHCQFVYRLDNGRTLCECRLREPFPYNDGLSLPGSIPGLLQPGCPVIRAAIMAESDELVFSRGILLHRLEDDKAGERWLSYYFDPKIGRDVGYPPYLDLLDEMGRLIAQKWLLNSLRHHPYACRHTPGFDFSSFSCVTVSEWQNGSSLKFVQAGRSRLMNLNERAQREYEYCQIRHIVPRLKWDMTLLPDGSFKVEAEVLKQTVLHFAGLKTEGAK